MKSRTVSIEASELKNYKNYLKKEGLLLLSVRKNITNQNFYSVEFVYEWEEEDNELMKQANQIIKNHPQYEMAWSLVLPHRLTSTVEQIVENAWVIVDTLESPSKDYYLVVYAHDRKFTTPQVKG